MKLPLRSGPTIIRLLHFQFQYVRVTKVPSIHLSNRQPRIVYWCLNRLNLLYVNGRQRYPVLRPMMDWPKNKSYSFPTLVPKPVRRKNRSLNWPLFRWSSEWVRQPSCVKEHKTLDTLSPVSRTTNSRPPMEIPNLDGRKESVHPKRLYQWMK